MFFSRSFKISLLLSTLIHLGAFVTLSHQTVVDKILTGPKPLSARRNESKIVRFELIETPASAEIGEAPESTRFFSDKNTRAQDKFQGEKKLEDSPHMEGRHEDSKDTRKRTTVIKPPEPPTDALSRRRVPPDAAAQPKEQPPRTSIAPDEETFEPKEKIIVEPEPRQEDLMQLARKEPEPATLPATNSASTMMSMASSKNLDADAQITGELTFAATRYFFGEYALKIFGSIEQQWRSRLVSGYTSVKASQAVIDFKIQPDGHISDVVVHSSEGDSYFPLLCVSSIHDAQPFDKIPYDETVGVPEDLRNKPLNIRFTFRYN